MPKSPSHVTSAGVIPLLSIIIPPRIRREDKDVLDYIENSLAPSILENGLQQAPTLHVTKDLQSGVNLKGESITSHYSLISGWCRCKSFHLLDFPAIPYSTRDSVSEADLLVLELEENTRRRQMTWQDRCTAIFNIHNKKILSNPKSKWGVRQTGELLGVSHGHTQDCVTVAKYLRDLDKEICLAPSFEAAQKILLARKQESITAELARRHTPISIAAPSTLLTKPNRLLSVSGPLSSDSKLNLSSSDDLLLAPPSSPPPGPKADFSATQIALSEMLFHADNRDWFAGQPDESFDIVCTDIPFAIDMANLSEMNEIDEVKDEHDVDENLSLIPGFFHNSFRVLKDNTYLFTFYDIVHQEFIVEQAKAAGFDVQPYPLLWLKPGGKCKAHHCYWTKACEYVLVCRKGKPTLRHPSITNYFTADARAERKLQRNPFCKPFEFIKWMLDPVAIPGMRALDPYAGGGSIVRAMINLGLKPVGVEKKESHFHDMLNNVQGLYKDIVRGEVKFV